MQNVYSVAGRGLRLRELPSLEGDILVELPHAHIVTRLDDRDWGDGFWRVETDLGMMTYNGYVASAYLAPFNPKPAAPTAKRNVTPQDLLKVVPDARKNVCEVLAPAFTQEFPKFQINTALRIAHFVAQMAHECAFKYMEELGGEAYLQRYEGRRDLGNTQPGDGVKYKGRGIIQLTGRANYRLYGQKLGLDLEGNPEMAKDPIVATKVALTYWMDRKINDPADKDDVYTVTRRINGGLNGIDDRIMKLKIAKTIWA